MPDSLTDISDLTWDDLVEETEYSILRELAKERDGVNGNGSAEEIAAGLLKHDGRPEEIPDEFGDDADDEPESDDADADESDDADADESDDEQQEVSNERTLKREPHQDASFIIEASTLVSWLEPINALVDEAKIHLTHSGFQTKAVDPANVGMVDAQLPPRDFESYDVQSEGIIGANTNRLDSVLNGADSDTLVHLRYIAETRNLVVEYEGNEFTIALIDPDSIRQEPDLPNLDLPVKAEVSGDDLTTTIGYADEITDHVALRADPEDGGTFWVYGEGDTDSYEGKFNNEDEQAFDATFVSYPQDEVLSLFSLDYLKNMTGAIGKGLDVTVRLGNEFPVHMIFDVDDEASGEVTFMLAPRIQSD